MKRFLMAAGGAAVLLSSSLGVSYAQTTQAHPLAHLRRDELHVAATALGLPNLKALRTELAGSTLTAVAQKHNIAPSTVSAAITTDLNSKIQAAENAGTITSARATKLSQRLGTRVDKLMTHQFPASKNA